jgi:hypothetical protein
VLSDEGLRFDNDQDLPPILPELGKNHPEESIPPMQLRPVDFPVEDGQLLTQGEILCRERYDRAEWLRVSLTSSISRSDEVFGRDRL